MRTTLWSDPASTARTKRKKMLVKRRGRENEEKEGEGGRNPLRERKKGRVSCLQPFHTLVTPLPRGVTSVTLTRSTRRLDNGLQMLSCKLHDPGLTLMSFVRMVDLVVVNDHSE